MVVRSVAVRRSFRGGRCVDCVCGVGYYCSIGRSIELPDSGRDSCGAMLCVADLSPSRCAEFVALWSDGRDEKNVETTNT